MISPEDFSPSRIMGEVYNVYLGYATSKILRFLASSGGIVTALLTWLLERGRVDGAIVTQSFSGRIPIAKTIVAISKESLEKAMGSKYIPTLFSNAFKNIDFSKSYVVVGLPCQLYALTELRKIDNKKYNTIKLTVGLICGGLPTFMGTFYVLKRLGIGRDAIIKDLRHRGYGWPGYMSFSINDKKIFISYRYFARFIFPWFEHKACRVCLFGFNPFADIVVGDAWIPSIVKKDTIGTSVIAARNHHADSILKECAKTETIRLINVNSLYLLISEANLLRKISNLPLRLHILQHLSKKYFFKPKFINYSSNMLKDYLRELSVTLIHELIDRTFMRFILSIVLNIIG
ncbi:MAG: Coenzyme F420 hydrogenase/dehydrogenase, beta subunit C-terminal domain [Nitrososphaerota archaeon]